MSKRSDQIDKLLRVKELRRRLAELEAAKARRSYYVAQNNVQRAKEYEQVVLDNADEKRRQRLEKLLTPGGNAVVQNVLAANTHQITAEEIAQSRDTTNIRIYEMNEAQNRAKLEQIRLAQSLRVEERTKKLCERLAKMKQAEQLRSE